MHIVVTGAGGFVGGHLAHGLHLKGHRVTAVVRHRDLSNVEGLLESVCKADLRQGTLTLPDDPDIIIHAAAQARPEGPTVMDYIHDNLIVTQEITAYARRTKAKGILFLSAVSAFGNISDVVVDEQTPSVSPGPYGLSKLLCEHILKEVETDVPSISLRLPGILGSGAREAWLTSLIRKFRRQEDIVIYNPQSLFNNAVHVDDLVSFADTQAATGLTGANMLVLGADAPMTVMNVVKFLRRKCRSCSDITIDTAADANSFRLSINSAKERFAYHPMAMREILKLAVEEIH